MGKTHRMYGPLSQHTIVTKPRNLQRLPVEIIALILDYAVTDYRVMSASYNTSIAFRKLVINLKRQDMIVDVKDYITCTEYEKFHCISN
jgi:hypothetical protein